MKPGAKTKQVEERLDQVTPKKEAKLLSTGSTLLNLACSGDWRGGFLPGKYYYLVGDSASGKTFLSMTCFAEASLHPDFKNYRLIYDNVEDGCLLDLPRLFGQRTAERVEPPARYEDGSPAYSETAEEFFYNLDDATQSREPFIYVLDSMDGLSSEAEGEKFDERKRAFRKGTEAPGSYGDGKAKQNSQGIRRALAGLRDTGSILIVISQTRDNLTGLGFKRKTRSGGHALRFYATLEIWSSVKSDIKKQVGEKKRSIGTRVLLKVEKNRITGRLCEVVTDIYPSYGIDDVGSCVDWLIDEGFWTGDRVIQAPELKLEGTRDKLVRAIEDKGKVDELRAFVGRCWDKIQSSCDLQRRGRYVGPD